MVFHLPVDVPIDLVLSVDMASDAVCVFVERRNRDFVRAWACVCRDAAGGAECIEG